MNSREPGHPLPVSPAERRRLLNWAMQRDDGLGFFRGVRNAMLFIVLATMLVWGACRVLAGEAYQKYAKERCEWCGAKDSWRNGLNVHHNLPQHVRPDLANEVTNLVTLCRQDHFSLGHRRDWRDWNDKTIEMVQARGKGATP